MNSSWRFAPGQGEHSAASLGNAPDWVAPFLELDQRFQSGQAQALSSGSTGPPKELTFDVNWIRASALATESHFGLQLKPRSAPLLAWSPLPMAGVGGRMMWWRTRILGWDLTQNQPSSSPSVPAPPQGQERYDFAVATPQQAQALLQNGSLSRLSILLIGGAPIPASLEARLLQGAKQFGCAIHHGFGMTETLTHVATRPLGESNYRALDGVEFKISAQGALEIHSPARGVHHLTTRDAATPAKEGLSKGFLWKGRLDHVINTGGIKVHPAELERSLSPLLNALLPNRRWYLVGRPHPRTGEEVRLVIEGPEEGNPSLEKAIMDRTREACPGPERPRSIEWVTKMKETASGKVHRY